MRKSQQYSRCPAKIGYNTTDPDYLLLSIDDRQLRERSYRQSVKQSAIEAGIVDSEWQFIGFEEE